MRNLLVLALLAAPAILAAADPAPAGDAIADAASRRTWQWFGLAEGEAAAKAASASRAFAVMVRDGVAVEPPPVAGAQDLRVVIAQGQVIAARIDADPGEAEGSVDPTLIPWLGRPEAEIAAEAEAAQRPFRVISRDGESFPMTMDWNEQRVNAVVVGGMVVALSGG
ncbi:MAG: hypothetical protein RLZZ127_1727 [Planctomycetota bacterium]|jgi:hypothetical protein